MIEYAARGVCFWGVQKGIFELGLRIVGSLPGEEGRRGRRKVVQARGSAGAKAWRVDGLPGWRGLLGWFGHRGVGRGRV